MSIKRIPTLYFKVTILTSIEELMMTVYCKSIMSLEITKSSNLKKLLEVMTLEVLLNFNLISSKKMKKF